MTAITPQILLRAYAAGVFPMAESADDPALYWVEPEERGIFPLDSFHVPRSLAKRLRQQPFDIRVDTAFVDVIRACAEKTTERKETWINGRIIALYSQLHKMGFAHSVESWDGNKLVGGLYGVRIGAAFFGESMFSRETDASKIALVHLVARLKAGGFRLLDAQFVNPHLERFGVRSVEKSEYRQLLEAAIEHDASFESLNSAAPDTVLALATSRLATL